MTLLLWRHGLSRAPRSHDAEHLHHDGRREVADEHGEHQNAQRAASEHADDAIKLGQEFWADELSKHLEWIQRELNSADGRGQVWLHIGVLAAFTNQSFLGLICGHHAQVDTNCDRLAVFVRGQDHGIIVSELDRLIVVELQLLL